MPCRLAAAAALVTLLVVGVDAKAQCVDDEALMVGLSAASGLGAGTASGLLSSGILASADPDSSYSFTTGLLVSAAVTGGLSALYGVIDGFAGCGLARDQGGFAWSVPVTMAVVGGLLPLALWGAADRQDKQDLVEATSGTASTAVLRATIRF
jgi:hypothetical protein